MIQIFLVPKSKNLKSELGPSVNHRYLQTDWKKNMCKQVDVMPNGPVDSTKKKKMYAVVFINPAQANVSSYQYNCNIPEILGTWQQDTCCDWLITFHVTGHCVSHSLEHGWEACEPLYKPGHQGRPCLTGSEYGKMMPPGMRLIQEQNIQYDVYQVEVTPASIIQRCQSIS